METRAGYITVGAFAILLFFGGLVMAIWFGGVRLHQESNPYRIYFEGSVTGLSVGSPVRYRGVPVGSVASIAIDPANVERILVRVDIDAGVPIKTDMYAVLEAQGLTGVGYIQIEGGSAGAPDSLPTPEVPAPEIPSQASALSKVFETAPQIADEIIVLMARARAFLDEENEESFKEILTNLATVAATVAARSDEIEAAIVQGAAAASEVRAATQAIVPLVRQLDQEIGLLAEETKFTLSAIRGAAVGLDTEVSTLAQSLGNTNDRIAGTAAELEALVSEARPGMRDFANTGLYELTQFLVEARTLIANIDRVLRQIDRDPSQFLFGDRGGQVETE